MFGPDILVAPVTEDKARSRRVYLPEGVNWVEVITGRTHSGGQYVTADAPLSDIPVFVRENAAVLSMIKE